MARDIKVGLFLLAGLVLSGLVIFLIGDERRLFDSAVSFETKFSDVQGLKAGAPIRMGGIDIGHVSAVSYGKDPSDTTIYVRLSIVRKEAGRIKTDSVARIATKGLLGDKMVEITKGKAEGSVKPGGEITGEEPSDMFARVGDMAGKAENVMTNVEDITAKLKDEKLHKNLQESVASLNTVLKQVSEGDGYPHKFLTDGAEAERISKTIQNFEEVSQELVLTMRSVRGVVARVERGPGFAHELLYGQGPQKQIEQFGNAADEVTASLRGIREGNGLARDLLYGGKGPGAELVGNLNATAADVRATMADVRTIVANAKAGKGTIGALLVDPSIYDDVKSILGNVQRNDVLRALVRYSIKQDEKKPEVKVAPAAP